jgi:Ca-activated chloride channel family protein
MKKILLPVALLLGAVTLAAAARQEPTTLRGRVTASEGGPLAGAQIHVTELRARTVTQADGSYRLIIPGGQIPAGGGAYTVTATTLGRQTDARRVTLTPGATVTVDFQLGTSAVAIEGIVVNAVTAESRRERSSSVHNFSVTGQAAQSVSPRTPPADRAGFNTENYAAIDENPFLLVSRNALSTFSIDVDRASYSNVRRFLRQGQRPPKDAVRIEELLNYFHYDYPEPSGPHPFSVTAEVGPAPWNSNHRLVRIGLQGRHVDTRDLPPSNLVFLIDVSGSMQPANKLPLVKDALRMLVEQLRPQDRISLVVYAGSAGLVLDATPGDRKGEILAAIDRLEAGGSTAGGAGIRLAYEVARRNFARGGNNRVILATDGDFNVGASSDAEMFRLIEEKRREGTFLTVLGFGMGNLKDSRLEGLADRGNGNYAYVDDRAEARKTLVSEFGGTLFTIAKDVKLQVEFNPARVRAYRLIGYENRALRNEEFDDDRRDAGDMGAGHSVTALYEIVLVRSRRDVDAPDLRYQRVDPAPSSARSNELAFVKLRYKLPDSETSRLFSQPVVDRRAEPGTDFRFATAVAGFGMLLRDSPHKGGATVEGMLEIARGALGPDREGYRREFVTLAERYVRIARGERVEPIHGEFAER